jgi:arylsulfatase A
MFFWEMSNIKNSNLIDFTDFLPTFMEVAGASIPSGFHADGISFYKQLLNKRTKVRDWVYCHYDPNWGKRLPASWVHDKRWKLYSDERFYNVQDDPEELNPIPDAALTSEARKAKKGFTTVLEMYNKQL